MNDETEVVRLLAEIRDNQKVQMERQQESLALQREQFALVQQQTERAEKLQERAEQLQNRSARMVSTSRRVVVLIVIAVQGAAGVRILAAVPHISGPRMIDAEALEVRARLAFE